MNSLYKFIVALVAGLLLIGQAFAQDKKEPDLVFASPVAYAPYSSLDTKGYVHGFSISFTQALCKGLKMHCVYQPMDLPQMFPSVAENKVDAAIGAIAITSRREKNYAFTVPYLAVQINFIASLVNGKKTIQAITPTTLSGKTIAVQDGTVFSEYALKNISDVTLKFYDNEHELLQALVDHKVDLALVDRTVANFWTNQAQNHVYIVGKTINPNLGVGIMLNKNRPELLKKLNAAILKFTRTEDFQEMLNTFLVPIEHKKSTQN